MFRWNLMLRSLFGSPRQPSKNRRPGTPVRPRLEALEDRTLPSVSPLDAQPSIITASPEAAPAAAAITSHVLAMIDQRAEQLVTFEHNLVSIVTAADQVIYQEVVSMALQVGRIFGINLNPTNTSPNTAGSQPSSDSGAGRGNSSGAGSGTGTTTMANNASNQTLNNSTHKSGSGSGSGTGTTTTHQMPSGQGVIKAQPLASPGTGSGSFGQGGSGTGSIGTGTGSGYANVSGKVWLDNNGDGQDNNGEQGYSGIEVDLVEYSQSQPGLEVGRTATTTNSAGNYSFSNIPEGPDPKPYAIDVIFSSVQYVDVWATQRGPDVSKIDGHGYSAVFYLADGGWRQVKAGVDSMDVNTLKDNPGNMALGMNLVTLRDAINTGNNGGGLGRGPTIEPVRFLDTANKGEPLNGTIPLKAALDPLKASYDIVGPGSNALTVQGQGAANPFRIFTVNAGVTSTISGLAIKNGFVQGNDNGGGILNSGNLTLYDDDIIANQATGVGGFGGNGGGIYNSSGADLQLQTVLISGNTAGVAGGGLRNSGTVIICCGSVIQSNKASDNGGGISNAVGSSIEAFDNTQILGNTGGGRGGGVANFGTFEMQSGAISTNNNARSGGGLYNLALGSATLSDVAVQGDNSTLGGGIYVVGGSLTLKSGVSIGNNTANQGGGMFESAGTVKMSGGVISNNVASSTGVGGAPPNSCGGGVFVRGGTLTLKSVSINNNNRARNNGGGMFLSGGTVSVTGGNIANNIVLNSGAGIFNSAGTLTLKTNVNVDNNLANNQGGGLYLQIGSTTTFAGVNVNGNVAVAGNGVYWQVVVNGQQRAIVNFNNRVNMPALTDNDDPGGQPFQGP